ncbi:hypothetical protein HAX54_030042, partial [Datura stramonium]|nr:hypothetical protein [Datura stramonium]
MEECCSFDNKHCFPLPLNFLLSGEFLAISFSGEIELCELARSTFASDSGLICLFG